MTAAAGGALTAQTAHAAAFGPRSSDPRIAEWEHAKTVKMERGWSNESQGMCTDGTYWYVTTNKDANGQKRLYKLTLDWREVASIALTQPWVDHLGAPTYDPDRGPWGRIYVPVQVKEGYDPGLDSAARIWAVEPVPGDISTVGITALKNASGTSWGPQEHNAPWFAYNTYDQLLYSSREGHSGKTPDHVSHFYGYSPATGRLVKSIALPGRWHSFQGGGFGRDGRNLYMVSDHVQLNTGRKHIYAFDMSSPVDGEACGYWGSRINPSTDEAEGIAWCRLSWSDARDTHITSFTLINEADDDDAGMYNFWVPDPLAI